MKIANGVEMLRIESNVLGVINTIYPTLIYDKDTVVLVDAGYPGQQEMFREAVNKAGVSFDSINKIIITHHDMDHIGGLPGIVEGLGGRAEVISHEEEKPYITGDKVPVKIAQMEAKMDSLTDEMKVFYKRLKAGFANSKANVDKTVSDGRNLPYCGGITVIHTPGHTPGHICLYHNESKTLITGDAMNIENGKLIGPNPRYTFDMEQAVNSLKKLAKYDIENIITYHGGLYKDNASSSIAKLYEEYK